MGSTVTRPVQDIHTLGNRGKPFVAFPRPNIPRPENQAMHLCFKYQFLDMAKLNIILVKYIDRVPYLN